MNSTKKIIILAALLAMLLPLAYAAKLTDWLPAYGPNPKNVFEAAGSGMARLALSVFPSQKDALILPQIETEEGADQPPAIPEKIFSAPQKPYRFLIVGDSFVAVAGGFGEILEQKLLGFSDVAVRRAGKVSSGLSRPDYFDWPKESLAAINEFKPNVAVVMMGTNDAQSFEVIVDGKKKVLQYGTEQWDAEYSRRAESFIKLCTDRDIALYWVGLPAMRDPVYAAKIAHVGALQKSAAESDPMAKFLSGQELMAGNKSDYEPFMADDKGIMRATRNPDGVHLSYFGGTILTGKIIEKIGQDIQLSAPEIGN